MHHSLKDLESYEVVSDDTTGRVEDFLFDEVRLHVSAVAVDMGNWLVRRSAILSSDRLGRPDPETRRIPLRITRDEADEAPEIENWEAGWFEAPAFTAWPPIIVGPAGGTISPLLMQAQAQHLTGNTGARVAEDRLRDVTENPRRLRSFTTTRSAPVFATDGEIGRVSDMLLRPDSYDVAFLVIDTGGFLSHERHVVPAAALSHFAEGDLYAVLSVPMQAVEEAPVHDDPGAASDDWLHDAAAHFVPHLPAGRAASG